MQRDSNRPRRVAELIRRELAMIIPRELDHPLAGRITLTAAEVSRDFSSANVFFTLIDGEKEANTAAKALNHAAGYLRHHLMSRVTLRTVPHLRFRYDRSVTDGARLESLINRAVAEDKARKED